MKKLIIAKHSGYCFGVRRAVEAVEQMLGKGPVFTLGEIIHNKAAVEDLRARGAIPIENLSEAKRGAVVVIRSHGVPKAVHEQAAEMGVRLVDATCPFVKRIHETVRAQHAKGVPVIIAGHASHPEVIGINGWCAGGAYIVATPEEAAALPEMEAAALVAQTTFSVALFADIIQTTQKQIKRLNVFQTICKTTSERQLEARRIAEKADLMVIIGGRHSSNTQKLAEICRKACETSICVENTVELPIEKIASSDIIGIVAGASTPDWMIREVIARMNEFENTAAELEQTEAEAAVAELIETASPEAAEAPTEAAQEAAVVSKDDGKDGEAVDSNIMEAYEKTMVRIRNGQVLQGSIVQISDDEVCVNIGYKSDGFIPKRELSSDPGFDPKAELNVGDPITVEVIKVNDGEGNVLLSRKSVEARKAWDAFLEDANMENVYDGVCKEVVKSGVIAVINGVRAFIPASQLALKYVETEKMEEFVGQPMKLKIIDIDKTKKRIVASRKAVLQLEAEAEKKEKWNALVAGTRIKGIVRRLTDFGAFVDIGGIDGLIHVTDMGWGRVKSPADILKIGEEVEVLILSVDPEKERVSLGYKQLQPKPWSKAADKYLVGSVVEGRVVRIVPFGAFVSLEPTIDGLVHISQVATKRIVKVEDELKVGDIIKAKVLEVVPDAKRISLSRKEVLLEELQEQGVLETQDETREEEPKSERAPREPREPREQREPRRDRPGREPREPRVDLPPVQKTTVSLADFFPKLELDIEPEASETPEVKPKKAAKAAPVEETPAAEAVQETLAFTDSVEVAVEEPVEAAVQEVLEMTDPVEAIVEPAAEGAGE